MKEKGGVDESAKNCKRSSQIHITHSTSRAQCHQDLLSHSPSTPNPSSASLWMLAAFSPSMNILQVIGAPSSHLCSNLT